VVVTSSSFPAAFLRSHQAAVGNSEKRNFTLSR
jgi:hypothetical protein